MPGPDGPEGGGPDGSAKAIWGRSTSSARPQSTPAIWPAVADGDGTVDATPGLELGLVVADVSPVPDGVGDEVWLAQPTTTSAMATRACRRRIVTGSQPPRPRPLRRR